MRVPSSKRFCVSVWRRRGVQGATWEEIGESLGMSRQAAWEYYTRDARRIFDRAVAKGDELSEEEALRLASEEVAEIRRPEDEQPSRCASQATPGNKPTVRGGRG